MPDEPIAITVVTASGLRTLTVPEGAIVTRLSRVERAAWALLPIRPVRIAIAKRALRRRAAGVRRPAP